MQSGQITLLLQAAASNGRLMAAAMEALQLAEAPLELQQLTARLAAGEVGALPPVERLEAASMGGGLGAYAASSGTIYLNAEWLQTADGAAVLVVVVVSA